MEDSTACPPLEGRVIQEIQGLPALAVFRLSGIDRARSSSSRPRLVQERYKGTGRRSPIATGPRSSTPGGRRAYRSCPELAKSAADDGKVSMISALRDDLACELQHRFQAGQIRFLFRRQPHRHAWSLRDP